METISNPHAILKGRQGELLAVKKNTRKKRWLVVIYKETNKKSGFVITAYITTDTKWLFKKKVVWNKK